MRAHQCRHEGAQLVGAGKAAPVQVATCWGEPSSRPPQARSKATGGGIARWGAKPRPVLRRRRRTGPPRHPTEGWGAAGALHAVKARRQRRQGGAQLTQPAQVMEHHRSAPPESADRKVPLCGRAAGLTFGECKTAPKSGAGFGTKTPRSRRFRLSKRRPFRDEKHHGMQQV